MTIRRNPIKDTIFKTTGIGHHVDREPGVLARIRADDGSIAEVLATELLAGERLVLNDLHGFKINSMVSASILSGHDPIDAIDRARERGHALVWISSLGAMLTSEPREAKPYIRVRHGMPVLFEGVIYRIDPASNGNIVLTRYVPRAGELS
ncbi:MAG TPA: hypothetical protein VIL88_17835 [Devosia sp.]|jgi:hypothetical protein|uniref:hypothetical protein n=1 Tax=Devosia sp. TaxID=1871048 RepID=UPI002F94B3FB